MAGDETSDSETDAGSISDVVDGKNNDVGDSENLDSDSFVTEVDVGQSGALPTEQRVGQGGVTVDESIVDAILESLTSTKSSEKESNRFNQYAYRKLSGFFRKHQDVGLLDDYRDRVNKARMDETFDFYLARITMLTLIVGVAGLFLGGIAGVVFVQFGDFHRLPSNPAVGVVLLALMVGGLLGASFGGWLYSVPIREANRRARRINFELPSALTFMYAQSKGGLPIVKISDRLANEQETYGEVAREFAMIMNSMDYLGKDYRSALREARETTPSQELAELLDDLKSVLSTRGDIEPFLSHKIDQYHERASAERERLIERVEKVVLGYTLFSALGILGGAVSVTVMLSLSGDASTTLLYFITYAVPIIGALFISIFLSVMMDDWTGEIYHLDTGITRPSLSDLQEHLNQSETVAADGGTMEASSGLTPRDKRGYRQLINTCRRKRFLKQITSPLRDLYFYPEKTLILTVPAALLVGGGVILAGLAEPTIEAAINKPYQTVNRLVVYPSIIIFIPISVYSILGIRRQDEINEELPDVLRKLASANETGMTLADSISLVSESTGEFLSNELDGVENELEYNVSLNNALIRFANRVRNPRTSKVMKILVEANTSSGDIREVLKVAQRDAKERWQNERNRRDTMTKYLVIMILGYAALVVTLWSLNAEVVPQMAEVTTSTDTSGASQIGAGFSVANDPPTDLMRMAFYHTAIIQAILTGLIAGKLARNSYAAGGLVSVIQMLMAVALMPQPFLT